MNARVSPTAAPDSAEHRTKPVRRVLGAVAADRAAAGLFQQIQGLEAMESRRAQRVGDLIHHEIAQILQKDVKDPRVRLVTLTEVDVSADLRSARVYYTVLGEGTDRAATARGLASARPFVRRELAHRLRLKAVPEIRFIYDESVDRGYRLLDILEGVQHATEEPNR